MENDKIMARAALKFLGEVEVASNLADAKYIAGWVIVTYDPVTEAWSASGLYHHPHQANLMAQKSEREITFDGSPPTCTMVLPVYNWDLEEGEDGS